MKPTKKKSYSFAKTLHRIELITKMKLLQQQKEIRIKCIETIIINCIKGREVCNQTISNLWKSEND